VLSNAIPIIFGSPEAFCFGNSIGGNFSIQDNAGAIAVYENQVGKTLACSSNASINGAANTAQRKTGQCAAF
jgi:hypothetical protein